MSKVTDAINQLQADHLVFYQKLRSFHWFVRGPLFFHLHAKFEELYLKAALDVDALAERSLALGSKPHATLAAATAASRVKEASDLSDARGMVSAVLEDMASLTNWLREAGKTAESKGDAASFNLVEGLADGYEKEQWMLRAFLDA